MIEGTTYHFGVDSGSAGTRLDLLVPRLLPDLSRSRGQQLIGAGLVTVNGAPAVKHYAVRGGDRLAVTLPPPAPALPQPEAIPLAILYEDRDLVAVDKPAGMVVHPAPGHPGGTLVNALLAAVPTLSGIGGEVRPGIVHRLDKGTSGVVLVAKNDRAHRALAAQFAGRTVEKTYLALAWGVTAENEGCCDTAIGRDTKDRQKISARTRRPRAAVTRWRVLRRLPDATLVELRPETGRTHQIRVHLAGMGHPVLGDPDYGLRGGRESAYRRASVRHGFGDRLALHAWKLRFTPPARRTPMEIVAPPPPQFSQFIEDLSAPARSAARDAADEFALTPGGNCLAKGWREGGGARRADRKGAQRGSAATGPRSPDADAGKTVGGGTPKAARAPKPGAR